MKDTFSREEVKEILLDICNKNWTFPNTESIIETWEKSKEVIYPEGILSFQTNIGIVKFEFAQKWFVDYQEWIGQVFKNDKNASIISVKNSSGEVLTVGDMTNFGKIESFSIINNYLHCDCEEHKHLDRQIDFVHPINSFETADGFQVNDNDKVYVLDLKHWIITPNILGSLANRKDYFIFRDYERAATFKELNKLRFSKQEIINAIIDATGVVVQSGSKADTDILKKILGL